MTCMCMSPVACDAPFCEQFPPAGLLHAPRQFPLVPSPRGLPGASYNTDYNSSRIQGLGFGLCIRDGDFWYKTYGPSGPRPDKPIRLQTLQAIHRTSREPYELQASFHPPPRYWVGLDVSDTGEMYLPGSWISTDYQLDILKCREMPSYFEREVGFRVKREVSVGLGVKPIRCFLGALLLLRIRVLCVFLIFWTDQVKTGEQLRVCAQESNSLAGSPNHPLLLPPLKAFPRLTNLPV